MSSGIVRDTGRVFGALILVPAATTVATLIAPSALPQARLGLAFPAPTGDVSDALDILLVNGRVLALVAGATILTWTTPSAGVWLAAMLTAIAALNVALISVAIADNGAEAVLALAAHAPLEMLAYSLAGAAFLHVRRRGTAARAQSVIALFVAAGGVLTVAAAVEVAPLWSGS